MIFISYSRKDKSELVEIKNDIKELGNEVWFDEHLSGGQKWWDTILENIRKADIFIIILTPNALNSPACKIEYTYAYDLNKPIFPILISEEINEKHIPSKLSDIQFLDYRKRDATSAIKLANSLNDLKGSLYPLPKILPPTPEIPISTQVRIFRRLYTEEILNLDEQNSLLMEIVNLLDESETKLEAIELLEYFKKRKELSSEILKDINNFIDNELAVGRNQKVETFKNTSKIKSNSKRNKSNKRAEGFTPGFFTFFLVSLVSVWLFPNFYKHIGAILDKWAAMLLH